MATEYIFTLNDDHGLEERRERVVRCRDCERALDGATCGTWCMEHHRYVGPRDFCAWGKERDGE